MQTINSNSFDTSFGSTVRCADSSYTALCDANEIIYDQCINCHDGSHDDWSEYITDAAWIASGSVVKGSPDSSSLITKLKNLSGNMPVDAPQISEEDYQVLRTWITNMP